MKPDIGKDYALLCSQQIPFTDYLFGDDLQKQLKDIVDVNKIGVKVQATRGYQRSSVPQVMEITLAAGDLFLTIDLQKTSKVRPIDLGGTKCFTRTNQTTSVSHSSPGICD